MQVFLRTLRIATFWGLSFLFILTTGYDIEFGYILRCAFNPVVFKDYFYMFNIISLISYPILFVVSVLYLKVHYGGITLVWSTRNKVGLLHLFLQNEAQLPFNIIFKINQNIFTHNENWFGASFLGHNESRGIAKFFRRIIGMIAYILFPIVMFILFLLALLASYCITILIFIH